MTRHRQSMTRTCRREVTALTMSSATVSGRMVIGKWLPRIRSVSTNPGRMSVNRILNAFQKEGLLTLKYKKILIRDPERLREVYVPVRYYGPEMSL